MKDYKIIPSGSDWAVIYEAQEWIDATCKDNLGANARLPGRHYAETVFTGRLGECESILKALKEAQSDGQKLILKNQFVISRDDLKAVLKGQQKRDGNS